MSGPGLDTLKMQASLESKLFGLSPPALTIGRFTVLERLGHGGMGVVFSVYDEMLDRRVAIKVLRGGTRTNGDVLENVKNSGPEDGLQPPGSSTRLRVVEVFAGAARFTRKNVPRWRQGP